MNKYSDFVLDIDIEFFANQILEEVLLALEDLKGYSGVGTDGDPYCTASWNAALVAARELIIERFSIQQNILQNDRNTAENIVNSEKSE